MSKAQSTRKYILEKSFSLIYEYGYQATSIDKIIEQTNVTKGAFYYHFKNKEEMGLAIINEILAENIKSNLVNPLSKVGKKSEVILATFKNFMLSVSERQMRLGCPTNNLIQEMAPLNEKFAEALRRIIEDWKTKLAFVIQQGIEDGSISNTDDPERMAAFIISSYEGTRSLGKLYKSYEFYNHFLNELKLFL